MNRQARTWRIVGLVVLSLAALLAAFDWTWFRPLIQAHIHERSGRRIDFDELQIGLDRTFAPTVRFRNLNIENAPWAAKRPLIRAAELSAAFDWASLLHGERVVVTRLRLVDAEVDLEQQADGLRNWRLTRPDDRGPGRIRVLTLDPERTRAHVSLRGAALELELQAMPLANAETLPGLAALPLTRTLTLRGSRQAQPFDGAFAISDIISFFDSAHAFALRGDFGVAGARVALQGQASDLLQFGALDLDLHASGARLAALASTFHRPLPASIPPLAADIRAHLTKTARAWNASQLVARIGRSDLSGTFEGRPAENDAPAQLRATLISRNVDLGEWRSGGAAAPSAPSVAPSVAPTKGGAGPRPDTRFDAEVDWQIATLTGAPLPQNLPITGWRAHAVWRDDRLALAPLAFAFAGGAASGQVTLAPSASTAALQLTGLRLDQLGVPELSGRLNARVALRSRGESVDGLLSALAGTVDADLQPGATLPATLDAKLGLDGGRWLRTQLGGGGQRSAVRAASLQLRLDQGIAAVQRLALETDTVLLTGAGSIDLPRRRVSVSVTPQRKQRALFALDDTIKFDGALAAPTISLARRVDQ